MKFKNSNNEWQTLKVTNYGIEQTPIGSMIYYPAQVIPKGYLVCDGSEILISEYKELFDVIGYIGGDDVLEGYFRLPDMRGAVAAGYYEGLASTHPLYGAFGDQVGSATHTLTKDELPEHSHAVDVTTSTGGDDTGSYGIQQRYSNSYTGNTVSEKTSSNNYNGILLSGGGNQPHSIVQPTKLYHWLIKAKNVVTLGGNTTDFSVEGNFEVNGKTIEEKIVVPTYQTTTEDKGQIDPNTTTEQLILSAHENCPQGTQQFYYIRTLFYGTIGADRHRTQLAMGYKTNRMFMRYYYNEAWSEWSPVMSSEIIENGTFDGGEYIKYSDGRMKVRKTVSGTVDITSSTMGGSFMYGQVNLGTFPVEFKERPTVIVSPQTQSGTHYFLAGSAGGNDVTAKNWGTYSLLRPDSRTGVAYTLDCIAEGRWA